MKPKKFTALLSLSIGAFAAAGCGSDLKLVRASLDSKKIILVDVEVEKTLVDSSFKPGGYQAQPRKSISTSQDAALKKAAEEIRDLFIQNMGAANVKSAAGAKIEKKVVQLPLGISAETVDYSQSGADIVLQFFVRPVVTWSNNSFAWDLTVNLDTYAVQIMPDKSTKVLSTGTIGWLGRGEAKLKVAPAEGEQLLSDDELAALLAELKKQASERVVDFAKEIKAAN